MIKIEIQHLPNTFFKILGGTFVPTRISICNPVSNMNTERESSLKLND